MCGIAGIFGKSDEESVVRMIDAMKHRGPDAQGFLRTPFAVLGHCRLSIIDLESGGQPMENEDHSVRLSFNGEIYNFQELREKLMACGRRFVTKSDTEVILRGYEVWGEDVFTHLDGMFAIAILDVKKRILLLARDRVGKKPLYWSSNSGQVIFASELKAILSCPTVPHKINPTALIHYFLFDGVSTPLSMVDGVRKLRPGHFLRVSEEGVQEVVYSEWVTDSSVASMKRPELIQRFDALLSDAVRRRLLLADVPVGVFLSGGIDSSTIAWYASRICKSPVNTFSIAFEDRSYDESSYAAMVAKSIGSIHHETRVTEKDVLDLVPNLASLVDEPIADPSIIPTYLVAKATRREAVVALSGDGADELLLGYATFHAAQIAEILKRVPFSKTVLTVAANLLKSSSSYMSTGFVARRFVRGLGEDSLARDILWRGSFDPATVGRIAARAPNAQDIFSGVVRDWQERTKGLLWQDALIRLYLEQYLMDDVLTKVDRASMAASLEVRSPFLATDIVSFLLSVPAKQKLNIWGNGKTLLKELMRDRLPSAILKRPKHGFAMPVADWLRGGLKPLLLDVLSSEALSSNGLLDQKEIVRMRDLHLSGKADFRKELWSLLVFELWRKKYFMTV